MLRRSGNSSNSTFSLDPLFLTRLSPFLLPVFRQQGNMGYPMAVNLAKHLSSESLPPLLVWNRTSSKLPAASSSLLHSDSLADIGSKCDVIIVSTGNDEAAKEVFKELFKAAKERKHKEKKKTIFIDTSTLYPTTTGEFEREATRGGLVYLACPVFGTSLPPPFPISAHALHPTGPPPAAEAAKLVFVVSGDVFAKKQVLPFLIPAMGRKSIDIGSNVERAAAFKLTGNGLVIGVRLPYSLLIVPTRADPARTQVIELLAESMTFADKNGVGSDLVYEFVKEFMPAPSMLGYGQKILDNDFDGGKGFSLRGGLKDATHIRRLATESGAVLPSLDAVRPLSPALLSCARSDPRSTPCRPTAISSPPPRTVVLTSTGLPSLLVPVSPPVSTHGRARRTTRRTRTSLPAHPPFSLLLSPPPRSRLIAFSNSVLYFSNGYSSLSSHCAFSQRLWRQDGRLDQVEP